MRGVSGPISRERAALMEQPALPLLLMHCAEQLHVHVLPDSCGIDIDSTTETGAPAKHSSFRSFEKEERMPVGPYSLK